MFIYCKAYASSAPLSDMCEGERKRRLENLVKINEVSLFKTHLSLDTHTHTHTHTSWKSGFLMTACVFDAPSWVSPAVLIRNIRLPLGHRVRGSLTLEPNWVLPNVFITKKDDISNLHPPHLFKKSQSFLESPGKERMHLFCARLRPWNWL